MLFFSMRSQTKQLKTWLKQIGAVGILRMPLRVRTIYTRWTGAYGYANCYVELLTLEQISKLKAFSEYIKIFEVGSDYHRVQY